MRILQIESDSKTRKNTEMLLHDDGFNIYSVDRGEEGIELAKRYDYDAVTLGFVPDMTSFDVIRRVRLAKIKTPILVTTEDGKTHNKVKALTMGADDYLVIPFDFDELSARLHALVRRSRGIADSEFEIGELSINFSKQIVSVKGKKIRLSAQQYKFLEILCLRNGMIVTKEMFFNHVYGGVDEPAMKIVDVYICKLRGILAKYAGGNGFIETMWGRGYRISEYAVKANPSESAMWMEPEERPAVSVS